MKSAHILALCAIVLLLLWWTYSYRQQLSQPIEFERLEMFGGIIDSFFVGNRLLYTKHDYYIVKNYIDRRGIDAKMDSLICQIKDPNYKEYSQYEISLYKESRMTNREKLLVNDRILERYSRKNDQIYVYKWFGGNGPKGTFLRRRIRHDKTSNKHYFQCEE